MQDAAFLAIQQLSDRVALFILQFGPVAVLDHPDDALNPLLAEINAVVLQRQQLAQEEGLVGRLSVQ